MSSIRFADESMRIRLKYSIRGKIRFISHLNLMSVFFRACIKKGLPVAVSQGYSPHLKLSFGPPLSVGVSGSSEYVDIYLNEKVSVERLQKKLQEALPDGIYIEEACAISEELPSLFASIKSAVYSAEIPCRYLTGLRDKIKNLLDKNNIELERKKKLVEVRPLLSGLRFNSNRLFIDVACGEKGSIKPIEILNLLWPELDLDELRLWKVNREELIGV